MSRERIRGEVGDRMIDVGLTALLDDLWTGNAGSIGLTQPRRDWRAGMKAALEVAFDELLKEPPHD